MRAKAGPADHSRETQPFCEETICPFAGTGDHTAGFGRSAGYFCAACSGGAPAKALVERGLACLGERVPALQTIYGDHRRLAVSAIWHSVSWVAGAGEVWIILALLGVPIGWGEGLVIESLGQAVRSAAFVPGALGVQDGGYMLVGTVYGLAPELGLALSLGKRIRELVLGVPGLLVWQAVEGRRLLARRMPGGRLRNTPSRNFGGRIVLFVLSQAPANFHRRSCIPRRRRSGIRRAL